MNGARRKRGEKGEKEKGNEPEISPQINNLPHAQTHQHPHSAKREPLDPLIRALIRITQLLLSRPQVLHLAHNLGDHLLDAAQVRLNGFELLLDLNAGPIAGVGADVNVEFDRAAGVGVAFYMGLVLYLVMRFPSIQTSTFNKE